MRYNGNPGATESGETHAPVGTSRFGEDRLLTAPASGRAIGGRAAQRKGTYLECCTGLTA